MTRLTCSKPGCDQPPQRKPDGGAMKFCQSHNDENRERNRRFRAERGGKPKHVTAAVVRGTEAMMSELTKSEAAKLADIERRMEERAEGMAADLRTIRDERLYKATHDTFEDYCRERWGITRQHANRLIRAESISEILEPLGSKMVPETVAREVLNAPAAIRAAVVEEVAANAPPDAKGVATATAAEVRRAVEKHRPHNNGAANRASGEAEPDAKPNGPAWAAFESEVEELVGELTAIERKMMKVLDSHAAENKCRAPWAYFIPYSGTVGLVRQARKSLLDNLPAEAASKHPGYISRKAVEQRDAVERQGRKSA